MHLIPKSVSLWIIAIGTILFLSAPARGAEKRFTQEELMAVYTMKTLNKAGNVGNFLKVLEPHMSPDHMANTKRTISKIGLSLKTKIPHLTVSGNKVIFDKNNYLAYLDKDTIEINGKKFKRTGAGMDGTIEIIYKGLGRKTAGFSVFPQAHAFDLGSILAVVGGGAVGAIVGSAFGIGPLWGAVAGVGAVYAGTWLYQSVRDGEVSCDNYGGFVVRKAKAGGMFLGSSAHEPVPMAAVSGACGGAMPPCNPGAARDVERYLKDARNVSMTFCGQPDPRIGPASDAPANSGQPLIYEGDATQVTN